MVGPQLHRGDDFGSDLDPELVFRERGSRLGAGIRSGGGAYREGSGRPGAPAPGEAFRPSRDLGAKRDAFAGGAPSGSLGRQPSSEGAVMPVPGGGLPAWDDAGGGVADPSSARGVAAGLGPRETGVVPPRPIVPGERRYRDGDRIHHAKWGDGIVITSKLTRDDEEVTVAFKDPGVGRKTMLASLANLELTG